MQVIQIITAPVTWWRRASPQFWSRWGPFLASQLLNPLVDYLWRGADWNTVIRPADRKDGARMRWWWWWCVLRGVFWGSNATQNNFRIDSSFWTLVISGPPSIHWCRSQGSSLRGLSLSAVCLPYSSAMLFLMNSWLSSVRCSSNHVVVFTVRREVTTNEWLRVRRWTEGEIFQLIFKLQTNINCGNNCVKKWLKLLTDNLTQNTYR